MQYEQIARFKGHELLFDIECYKNYFLIGLMDYQTGETVFFDKFENPKADGQHWDLDKIALGSIIRMGTLVGFNSKQYDFRMLSYLLNCKDGNPTCGQLHELSTALINSMSQIWRTEKKYKYELLMGVDHIDLMPVAPAAAQMLSLKHYGARMNVPKVQDLPIEPTATISLEQVQLLREYNYNDLCVTGYLRHYLDEAIKLRRDMSGLYRADLRSLSDAQVAEKVIVTELETTTGYKCFVPKIASDATFVFKNPSYIQFYSPQLQAVHRSILETVFVLDKDGKMKVREGDSTKSATNLWKVQIGGTTYKLGIGGLHSSEKSVTHRTVQGEVELFDRDVTSYYPQIIINQGLAPSHLGPAFLATYRDIVARRLKAKEVGDKATANSLKIAINGSFGKLGSKYSVFFSPDLLIQVTITGQLSLLMLIEMLEWSRIPVVSGNTDGILVKCPVASKDAYLRVVRDWEAITGFQTEETAYRSVHARDVNNYIAIGSDGSIKAKGAYTNEISFKDKHRESLMTNPSAAICSEAVMLFLRDGKPIEETILWCDDITKFLLCRRAKGGGMKDGQYLGKIVRWYIKQGEYGCIQTCAKNKAGLLPIVGESDGAQPIQQLPHSLPTDIDYNWYIQRATEILNDIGVVYSD